MNGPATTCAPATCPPLQRRAVRLSVALAVAATAGLPATTSSDLPVLAQARSLPWPPRTSTPT